MNRYRSTPGVSDYTSAESAYKKAQAEFNQSLLSGDAAETALAEESLRQARETLQEVTTQLKQLVLDRNEARPAFLEVDHV